MKTPNPEIAQLEAAIARYTGYYQENPKPEYWRQILTLQATLRERCPQKFRKARLKAA